MSQFTEETQVNLEQESGKDAVTRQSEASKKGSLELSDQYNRVVGTTTMTPPLKGEQWESFMPKPIAQSNIKSVVMQNRKPSRFEAEDAEAELDKLLDSFSESKISESAVSREEPNYIADASSSGLVGVSPDEFVPVPVNKGQELSKSAFAGDLDDMLDDLLKETSGQMYQDPPSLPNEVKSASLHVLSPPSSVPAPKSKVLDDFDSWLDTI